MTCLWRSDRKLCFVVVCHVGFVLVLSSVTVLIENLCYLQWHVFTLWIIHTGLSFWHCKPLCFFLLSDVIHTVGPIARGNLGQSQRDDLESCYKYSLKLMKDNNLRSVVSIKAFKTDFTNSPLQTSSSDSVDAFKTVFCNLEVSKITDDCTMVMLL